MCGGQFYMGFVANFMLFLTVKELWRLVKFFALYNLQQVKPVPYARQEYLPEAQVMAKNFCISVVEVFIANSSPGSVVPNFQKSFVCHVIRQSH